VTLTFNYLTPGSTHAEILQFGVDSSSGLSVRVRTQAQTPTESDATDHLIHASATAAGVGIKGENRCAQVRPGVEWQSAAGIAARWRWRGTEYRDHETSGRQHIVLVRNPLTGRFDGSQLLQLAWKEETWVGADGHRQWVRWRS